MGLSTVGSLILLLIWYFPDFYQANFHTCNFFFPFNTLLTSESFEPVRAVSVGATSKGVSKGGRSAANGVSKQGNRAISSVWLILLGLITLR